MIEIKYWVLAGLLVTISPLMMFLLTQLFSGLRSSIDELTKAVAALHVSLEKLRTWSLETFVRGDECDGKCHELKALVQTLNAPHRRG